MLPGKEKRNKTMANAVKEDVIELVEKELKSATEKFGALNNSDHESFSVLAEEIEEAVEAVQEIIYARGMLWNAVRRNKKEHSIAHFESIKEKAIELAIEAVQVAAMAEKGLMTAKQR